MAKQEPQITMGTCEYCDQQIAVSGCGTQEEADAQATRLCKCPDAAEAYGDGETREEKIEKAEGKIDDLFGGGSDEPVGDDAVALLKTTAAHLIDRSVKRASITVDDFTVATMFRMAKGNISIERKDSTTEKAEI